MSGLQISLISQTSHLKPHVLILTSQTSHLDSQISRSIVKTMRFVNALFCKLYLRLLDEIVRLPGTFLMSFEDKIQFFYR